MDSKESTTHNSNQTMRYNNRPRYFLIPIAIIGFAFLAGLAVMLLWNAILPDIANVRPLNFWQALGLLALCRLLFGGFRGGPGRPRGPMRKQWREKWMHMNEEERAQFREQWKRRCAKD